MRKTLSLISLLFILPLAACFDAEMSLKFPDDNTAEATMVMTAGADFYQMATANGDPFCDGGVEAELADGSHSCTETFSGTIDEAMNNPDIGEGMTIEKRDGGQIYVAWELSTLTEDIVPPDQEGSDEMKDMLIAAFEGHAITLKVSGAKIIETNGEVSEDGKTVTFRIPLEATLKGGPELPKSFEALVQPGA